MKRNRFAIIVLLFLAGLFLFNPSLSQVSYPRSYWLKTVRKGTAYGYEHRTRQKLDNGNYEYKVEALTKTDVAGFNPQEIVFKGNYVVSPDLRPLSLEVWFSFQTKKRHVVGNFAEGLMSIVVEEESGKGREKDVSFEDAYFDQVLPDLILKREREKSFAVKIFSPIEEKVNELLVEITRSDETGVEATVIERLTTKYRINRQGIVEQVELVELQSRSHLTDSDDAQRIEYLNTADGYTLTIKSEQSFPNVYNVIQAQIQVRWKGIPFEEFNFEDNRQRVLKKSSQGGENRVILEMTKPAPPAKETMIPVKDEKLAIYLGESEYIKPNDPAIQKQLAEIAGAEKRAFSITQKILQWISINIQADMIAETLTGPEVLQKRRGKCSEFAIIFASLARAAGIPTRIVLGELNNGNLWMGHMWNEIWLGEWVAVDPSSGTFVRGASHLKFVDSSDVMGTQNVRWKLVDNLSIDILDFREESQAPPEVETGISGLTYTNKNFLFRISAPDETWSIQETERSGQKMLEMKWGKEDAYFALVPFAVPPGTEAKAILDGRLRGISGIVKNFEKLEEGEMKVAGRKAPRAVFDQMRRNQEVITNENCLLIEGNNAYLFVFICPKLRFAELRPLFPKIIESFEIIR